MADDQQKHKASRRAAIIGLIGTILTACGGLAGALIGGLTTLYEARQEAQQIAISAPQSDQQLIVNTRQVAIKQADAETLDPSAYVVLQDLGFVMAQPRPGWEQSHARIYQDLFLEEGTNLSPLVLFSNWIKNSWDEQPLRQLRYAEPVSVQYLEGTTENEIPVDLALLENDTLSFYSQMTILALDKAIAQGDFSLYGLALTWGSLHEGGVNEIVANPDSQYIFEQVSWELKGVKVNGRQTDLTLERWGLFAEGPDHDYIVEVQYVPAAGQSGQVWDDLQAFLNAFRVIQ